MLIVAGLLIAVLAVLLVLEPVLRAEPGVAVRPVAIFSDSDDEDEEGEAGAEPDQPAVEQERYSQHQG